jgi:hypothetical protein
MATKTKARPAHIPTTGFAFDADTHSYYFDGKPMTGCTTILGVLAKPALIQWAANEVVKYLETDGKTRTLNGMAEDGSILYAISETALQEARTAHARKRDDAAEKGTDLHALVEEYVRDMITYGGAAEYGTKAERKPIEPFMQWAIKNKIRFIASEKRLYSKELWVAGTCDLVFEKDGKRYVGDIKTYAKIWDRVPFFQCAGYSIMWEEMEAARWNGRHKAKLPSTRADLPVMIDGYCVLRLSKDGTFEDLWSFDVEGDKSAFLACVTLYRRLQEFKQITVH